MGAPEHFKKAADGFTAQLQTARDDQWNAPTPCSEWDVRALVNHVIGEVLWIPPMVEGKTIADVGNALDGDLLGDDPKIAWSQAAEDTVATVSAPGAMQRTVHLSYGDRSAEEDADEVATDILIHTWDLARGLGRDVRLDPEMVELAMPAFSSAGMEGAR